MKNNPSRTTRPALSSRFLSLPSIAAALAVSGCSTMNLTVPQKLEFERSPVQTSASVLGEEQRQRKYSEVDTPSVPARRTNSGTGAAATPSAIADGKADLTVAFDQMPLPTFIQAVYGNVLKVNYSMDAAVAARTDLITFRTPHAQSPAQMAHLARMLLKSYGIAVQDFGGVLRIVPDNASTSYLPQIRRGRALPETPVSLRPIFHYVELEAVRVSDFSALMRTMFGNKIQLQEDAGRNALLISGGPDDVNAALEVVQVFDQPIMRGQRSRRVSPVFWTADEFARKLAEILSAEGYVASTTVVANTPVLVLPIAPLNSVVIFSSSEAVLNHALKWAKELDQPPKTQAGGAYFTYPVKYADAQALAKTLGELIGDHTTTAPVSTPAPGQAGGAPGSSLPGGSSQAQIQNNRRSSRIVVNNATNTLIIQGGGPDEYRQWTTLLAELDKPTKSALIDVVVAEVKLGGLDELGVDWGFRENGTAQPNPGGVIRSATAGAAGLNINFLNGAGLIRARLNAMTSNKNAQILSSPKLMARNGETATIQVGDEVPIITSQQSTPGSIFVPSNGILQTIQYRNTGVLLRVRPIINSGNRIDLDISQEVSNAIPTKTGVDNSPTISTRKIDTKLSLRDGSTVMLAGLITNDNSQTESGVPLLKDIPGVGAAFKSNSVTNNKTEMVVLITPYIINDDFEAESITTAFQNSLGEWASSLKENFDARRLRPKLPASEAPVGGANLPLAPADGVPPPADPVPAVPVPPQSSMSAPAPQAPAPSTRIDVPADKVAPPASLDRDETVLPDGVIMSKPSAPAVPPAPPAGATTPTPKAGAADKDRAPPAQGSSRPTSPAPVGGRAVQDPALLEELRRAIGK